MFAIADESGCGFYRIREPARVTSALGVECEIVGKINNEQRNGHIVHVYLDADVVVFQRPMFASLVEMIDQLHRQGIATVVEIDDNFSCLPPTNIAFYALHPAKFPDANWNYLAQAARRADLVTVSTQALADRYGSHGRVVVLHNCIPEANLSVTKVSSGDPLVVGWTGAIGVHYDDLGESRGAIGRAVEDCGAKMMVIGSSSEALTKLGATNGISLPWVEMEQYAHKMAQFDVGVVPLAPNQFNQAKSNLKGLEMASLGIPFVASPTIEYQRLHALGAGVLATKPKNWTSQIKKLLIDESLRAQMSQRGREVASTLTFEGRANLWADAWQRAMDYRRVTV